MIFLAGAAIAAQPRLKRLDPPGAQQGKPFQLTVVGEGLPADAEVLSALPAVFTALTSPGAGRAEGEQEEQLRFLVELKEETPVGLYPIRLATEDGLSNLLLFSVGAFAELSETAGPFPSQDSAGPGRTIDSLPVTVNAALADKERDLYRIRGRKGQRLVIEVEARRLGSAIDPVVRLLDSRRKQLAMNNDTPGLGLDCRLDVSFPQDGDYIIVVHDARFSEQPRNFYRLKIGNFSYAGGIFPLGWSRGTRTKVNFLGGNLPGSSEVEVDLTGLEEKHDFTTIPVPGDPGSLPFTFAVSGLPEVLEPSGQELNSLTPSTVFNGRISEAGEVDQFRLSVGPGEHWFINLDAAGLGTSRLSGVLTVYDQQGRILTSGGDEIPDIDVFNLVSPGSTSSDPHVSFQVPEGLDEVLIAVEDLAQRGGPFYGYRLRALRQPPEFTLTLTTPYINVPEGGTASVGVSAERRGFMGSIRLTVDGLDEGLTVKGGLIPSESLGPGDSRLLSRQGVLTVTARQGTSTGIRELSVWGEAELEDGTVIRRRARGPALVAEILGGITGLENARRDDQKAFTAPWLGIELPTMVGRALPAQLTLASPERIRLVQGMEYDFHWEFVSTDSALKPPQQVVVATPGAREIRVKRGNAEYEKSGVVTLSTTEGTPHTTFNVVFSGEVEIQGRQQTVYTPAVAVEVVKGYDIVVPSDGFTLQPGGRAELVATIRRDPAFKQAVEVKAENLPPGVLCTPTEVLGEQQEMRMPCQVKAATAPGEYPIELTSSSVLAGRDKEKVSYRISPVQTLLLISPKSESKVSRVGR